jgi:hypothetical protein
MSENKAQMLHITFKYTSLLAASWLATQCNGTLELGAGVVLTTCVPRLVLNI